MLKTVVMLNIFVETIMQVFFAGFFNEERVQKNTFEMEIFCNIRFLQCFYGNRKLLSGLIFWFHNYVFILLQMKTKRPVWNELKVRAVMMGHPGSVEVQKFPHALISIYLVLAFTPFVSFLIVNVAAEKEQRLKDTMSMMGLYDSAFWLSWGLLYAALVTTMSILMAVIATCTPLFSNSNFFVIFLLIFLYGISSVSPSNPPPKFASTVGSMLTVVFGCLSLFTVLMRDFPQSAVWLLCLLSPSAFSIGIAQVTHFSTNALHVFSSLGNGPHALYVPMVMLFLDCILYLLLAIYLDQVLPGEFGTRRSVLYFLQPSYWSKRKKRYVEVSSLYEGEVNGTPVNDESVEAVSPEFRGKEVIRICNIRKMYREKDTKVEALRGLTFDIYEGQITALLGHSGAGKSTLMNILCGICPPTEGTATIYGSPVAEIADGAEMKQLVGICPQFNIIFDVLTVEEHLRIFAAIKGILPSDIDGEVRKVLRDLDLEKIMDAQAKNLSGGQKRKLSVGIAILGDPKILLLDEPTAGMDPVSRHQVWSLLKSRRAGRSFTAQSHTPLCIFCHTDRKAVISQGQLKCVGSSLYLKTKCGVGYHLRMSVTEGCEVENITSLVKQHVPKAQLSRQQEAELTFTLPFESMDTFPGLFAELDCRPDLGIINYGVSMTTLEDVFLRLEAEAEVDQAGKITTYLNWFKASSTLRSFDMNYMKLIRITMNHLITGRALWRQQFSTVNVSTIVFQCCFKNVCTLNAISVFAVCFFFYQLKCRSTLRISGLVPSAYWCGQAAIDVPFYYLILICMTSTLFAFHSTNLLTFHNIMSVVRKPMVLFTYCVSFMFVRVQSNRDFFSVVSMMVSLQETFPQLSNNLNNNNKTCSCGKTWKYQVILNQNAKSKAQRNPEENVSEDEDVQVEKARVKEVLTCQCCEEKPVVVVSNLRKQYKGKMEGFSLSKRRKVATKNVSFCVRKGEVLGLLGPNGAGKSTIMHMLSGDTEPTAGQVLENPLEHVGCCPQVNPLWPRITLQEHLEIYAAIKGLRQRDIPNIIKRVVNALELKDHLYKQAKNLSAGLKRKLCFALSMLGNPQIVLLDEPSTGMDPKSKQRMWRAIRAAFKNKQRGALLTTHYMEEAEAVCDRVAIMVSGQLRCIGSIQHLKGKFGRGYSLEINLREELTGLQQVALLHKEILKIFPHAARQDSFATLMVYKIPMEDVKSLAKSFAQLESAKQNFNFEEYNFSQSTLEQVFMEFAKEQENEEEEVGSLSTTFQWQRLRPDGPVSINHADSIVHQL
uniref:ATP binding cassette subfamily A member 5 n=1 Tax=Sinocyclocheilus grahami TaxID=75366 RepID=A0A672M103_SINGR